jgi:hypothetical protein
VCLLSDGPAQLPLPVVPPAGEAIGTTSLAAALGKATRPAEQKVATMEDQWPHAYEWLLLLMGFASVGGGVARVLVHLHQPEEGPLNGPTTCNPPQQLWPVLWALRPPWWWPRPSRSWIPWCCWRRQ